MYGYQWEPDEHPEPRCPCCGEICETIYRDINGDIVGCSECLESEKATECEECYGEGYGG